MCVCVCVCVCVLAGNLYWMGLLYNIHWRIATVDYLCVYYASITPYYTVNILLDITIKINPHT